MAWDKFFWGGLCVLWLVEAGGAEHDLGRVCVCVWGGGEGRGG